MDSLEDARVPRKQILIRLLYTLLYLIIFEILRVVVQVSVFFQYIYLFITRRYSMPLRNFSNKLSVYAYKILRYVTLNENYRPFPFNEFPVDVEKPENQVQFE